MVFLSQIVQGGDIGMLHGLPGLPSYRQRTLAQLEELIARAEGELSQHQTTGGRVTPSGRASDRTVDKLRLAAARLTLLRRSRQFLLSGEFLPEPSQRH
jgi:hypothetical protein